jgi:hypothetical protein
MKKIILLFTVSLFVFVLSSCDNSQEKIEKVGEKPIKENISNPNVLIGYYKGSSFGNFFQTLYKYNQYDEMLKFTSLESLELHGKEKILDFYKNMDFAYDLGEFKSAKDNGDGTLILIYPYGEKFATNYKTEIKVKMEDGIYKIILPKKLDKSL